MPSWHVCTWCPHLGHLQLQKLAPQHVQTMMNAMGAAGLSPRTVAYARAVMRRALNQAIKWELVTKNAAALTDPPAARHREIHPFTPEQARAFLDAVRGHRQEALYTVALAIGLRQGEALGLRWEDLDLDTGQVHVRKQIQRIDSKLQLVDVKTAKSRRTIPLPTTAIVALRAHRTRQLEERLLAGRCWQDRALVFPTMVGTPQDGNNTRVLFQRLVKRAGLPPQRFHDLRHACASLLLFQGVPARVVMEILGHSNIGITMNTYSHVMPQAQRDAANLMDAILSATS
jgi:integrase